MSLSTRVEANIQCVICFDSIVSEPSCDEEREKKLDCSHIFHRECIGEWVKKKHNCPVCRAHVGVGTPEARQTERSSEEILVAEALVGLREEIREIRNVRVLRPDEDAPVSRTAANVNAVAARMFGW
ncbi:MAG: RING finger domain-containing protein [Waddliaceae bacterium]